MTHPQLSSLILVHRGSRCRLWSVAGFHLRNHIVRLLTDPEMTLPQVILLVFIQFGSYECGVSFVIECLHRHRTVDSRHFIALAKIKVIRLNVLDEFFILLRWFSRHRPIRHRILGIQDLWLRRSITYATWEVLIIYSVNFLEPDIVILIGEYSVSSDIKLIIESWVSQFKIAGLTLRAAA